MMARMKRTLAIALAVSAFSLNGCVAVGLTALGVGMATGVSHTLSGIVYKTFTTPQAQVRHATLGAFHRMQIKVVDSKRNGSTLTITAKAGDRDIEVELEALTPNTTRMLVTATKDGGILRDGATATEVILQTEKIVGAT
jgi:FlaG/FlaF family flagellin (archaellin)